MSIQQNSSSEAQWRKKIFISIGVIIILIVLAVFMGTRKPKQAPISNTATDKSTVQSVAAPSSEFEVVSRDVIINKKTKGKTIKLTIFSASKETVKLLDINKAILEEFKRDSKGYSGQQISLFVNYFDDKKAAQDFITPLSKNANEAEKKAKQSAATHLIAKMEYGPSYKTNAFSIKSGESWSVSQKY